MYWDFSFKRNIVSIYIFNLLKFTNLLVLPPFDFEFDEIYESKKAFLLNELISITLKNRNRKVVSLKMKLALT